MVATTQYLPFGCVQRTRPDDGCDNRDFQDRAGLIDVPDDLGVDDAWLPDLSRPASAAPAPRGRRDTGRCQTPRTAVDVLADTSVG